MKKLGNVQNVIHDGSLLLKACDAPAPGTAVRDARGADVGRVARVFGPVAEPYVSVRPVRGADPVGLLGSTLYTRDDAQGTQRAAERRDRPVRRQFAPGKKKGVNTWRRKGKPQKR